MHRALVVREPWVGYVRSSRERRAMPDKVVLKVVHRRRLSAPSIDVAPYQVA